MPIKQCEEAIKNAVALPDDYFNEKEMYQEAFALACQTRKTVYDMFFLVLTRRNNGILFTMDKTLKQTADKHSIKTY